MIGELQTLKIGDHPMTWTVTEQVEASYCVIYRDYDQVWEHGEWHVSRPTRNGTARENQFNLAWNRYGLPATARFLDDTQVVLTEDLQRWIHNMCWSRCEITEAQAKKDFASLFANDRAFSNKEGSGSHADFINWKHLDMSPIEMQPMSCSGNTHKLTGHSKLIAGEYCWEIEAIDWTKDYKRYTPETHPHLFFQPVNSVREEIWNKPSGGQWTGKYREDIADPFPQYAGQSILPVFGLGSVAYIPKWRVYNLPLGSIFPSPFVR